MHVLPDLVPFIEGLAASGINPHEIHLTGPPYSFDPHAAASIRSLGVNVLEPETTRDAFESVLRPARRMLESVGKMCELTSKRFLIVEDGGYLVPLLHDEFAQYRKYCLGAVEQTTNGIQRDRAIERAGLLDIPIASIPDSRLKQQVEPPFIAEAAKRNLAVILERYSGRALRMERVGIIGFGAIGEHVARELAAGARPAIYELSPQRALLAAVLGYETQGSKANLIQASNIVIGATGATHSPPIGAAEFGIARAGTIFVSVTSKQVEFDMRFLAENAQVTHKDPDWTVYKFTDGREIVLVRDGQPVNFGRDFSLPKEIVDIVYSLMLDSARQLLTGNFPSRIAPLAHDDHIALCYVEEYHGAPTIRNT